MITPRELSIFETRINSNVGSNERFIQDLLMSKEDVKEIPRIVTRLRANNQALETARQIILHQQEIIKQLKS